MVQTGSARCVLAWRGQSMLKDRNPGRDPISRGSRLEAVAPPAQSLMVWFMVLVQRQSRLASLGGGIVLGGQGQFARLVRRFDCLVEPAAFCESRVERRPATRVLPGG